MSVPWGAMEKENENNDRWLPLAEIVDRAFKRCGFVPPLPKSSPPQPRLPQTKVGK